MLRLAAAYRAEARVVMATPHVVPDPTLLSALCLAACRGEMALSPQPPSFARDAAQGMRLWLGFQP